MTDWPNNLKVDTLGYPNEDVLARFDSHLPAEMAATWLVREFPRLVESMPFGHVEVTETVDEDFGDTNYRIAFSTGGWSGQEDFHAAVCRTMAHVLYWESSRRGGHHVYEVPAKAVIP